MVTGSPKSVRDNFCPSAKTPLTLIVPAIGDVFMCSLCGGLDFRIESLAGSFDIGSMSQLLDEDLPSVKHPERQHEWLDETGGLPAVGNVLPVVLGIIGIGVVVCAMWALGPPAEGGAGEKLAPCVVIADKQARLACYDQIAALHQPARGALAPAQIVREGSQ